MANNKIAEEAYRLALPLAQENGYTVYETEYKKEGADFVLRIVLDTVPGGGESVSIDVCEAVSRALGDILDERDFISGSYILEVTSPGLDRPLKKPEDFERFSGRLVDVGLYKSLDGSKTISGTLKAYDGKSIMLECGGENVSINLSDAAYVRLAVVF